MEIKVLEKRKDSLKIELEEETHTFCNAIRKELWQDKATEAAGYAISHSLLGNPHIVIKSANPKKSLQTAANNLKKKTKEFRDLLTKLK